MADAPFSLGRNVRKATIHDAVAPLPSQFWPHDRPTLSDFEWLRRQKERETAILRDLSRENPKRDL